MHLLKVGILRIQLFLKVLIIKHIIGNKTFSSKNVLLIFSDPRGGGTWMAEILRSIPDTFIYWEPLHALYNKEVKKANFGWRQHIPKYAEWMEANQLFDRILSIQVVNEWTIQNTSIKEIRSAEMPIIKFCRGNDLLPWLVEQFKLKYKPIYLVRHPLAVVASQLKQGGWDNVLSGFMIPDMKYNNKYFKNNYFLNTLHSRAEVMLATWCLSNIHDFNSDNKWLIIFYEDLLNEPEKVLKHIFNEWDMPLPLNIMDSISIRSSTNVDYFEEDNVKRQLSKWRTFFSETELIQLQKILDHFGITYYSTESELPYKQRLPFLTL